jgi:hypothetical protein
MSVQILFVLCKPRRSLALKSLGDHTTALAPGLLLQTPTPGRNVPGMSVAFRSGLKKEACPFDDLHSGWFLFSGGGTNPSCTERTKKMNSENIKQVKNQAINQLVERLNAGHSEALNRYLSAMAKFRAYSLFNVLLILPRSFANLGQRASKIPALRADRSGEAAPARP